MTLESARNTARQAASTSAYWARVAVTMTQANQPARAARAVARAEQAASDASLAAAAAQADQAVEAADQATDHARDASRALSARRLPQAVSSARAAAQAARLSARLLGPTEDADEQARAASRDCDAAFGRAHALRRSAELAESEQLPEAAALHTRAAAALDHAQELMVRRDHLTAAATRVWRESLAAGRTAARDEASK